MTIFLPLHECSGIRSLAHLIVLLENLLEHAEVICVVPTERGRFNANHFILDRIIQ